MTDIEAVGGGAEAMKDPAGLRHLPMYLERVNP
jgi:hypothetical protein